jgi:hypothetical protein
LSLVDELKNLLSNLKDRVRRDPNVPGQVYESIVIASRALDEALAEQEKAQKLDQAEVKELYENAQRLSLMLENIKRNKGMRYPSYLDEFVQSIAKAPFTMPRTLYEPQGAEQISINVDGQPHLERAELALATLFPGSTTYRYAAPSVKIRSGRWFRSGRAHLSSIHELSPKPEFEIRTGDRTLRVYRPITLRAFRLHGQHVICNSCLSLSDGDETCGHSSLQFHAKLPSNHSLIRRVELSRKQIESKTLQRPINLLVSEVALLSELEVGLAVLGFERIASLRRKSKTVRVVYDPPIGIRLKTTGLYFKINVPSSFEEEILSSNQIIRRDIVINILSEALEEAMSNASMPSYNHELFLSSLIAAIGLDDPIDPQEVQRRLRSENLIPDAKTAIARELVFYETTNLDASAVARVFEEIQRINIGTTELRLHLRKIVLHSLAHVFLLAAAIASGSQLDDLDYLINDINNEVIVFDSVSGGNGASEAVFEFLTDKTKFSIKDYLASEERDESYRPKNFEEIAFEFLLPCINGVSDRIFLFGTTEPFESEIRRKLGELHEKESTHRRAITRIKEYGNASIYPIGVGYHGVDYSIEPQEADRFKETASVCLHGCPECISIAGKCHLGSFYEKYGISKLVLDRLLAHVMQKATLDKPSLNQILQTLSQHGYAILAGSCNDADSCKLLTDKLNSLALELDGQEVNEGHVKLAGHWIDLDSGSGQLRYCYMLKVI